MYALVVRIHYDDGTTEDLLQNPRGYIRGARLARAVAGVLSLTCLEGAAEVVAVPFPWKGVK